MSDPRSQSAGFEAFSDFQKSSPFDSFISTADPFAPHPEFFEAELDSNLAGIEDSFVFNNILAIPRSDTFTLSTFTASTDSAYDTVSTRSESFYNYPSSPYPPSNLYKLDFDMDLNQVHARGGSEYGGSVLDNDPTSFGALPPTPPRSPMITSKVYDNATFPNAACFSDYTSNNTVSTDQFFSTLEYSNRNITHATVAPMTVTTGSLMSVTPALDDQKADPRRKHKCPKCTRAFARAFNLKTHMATHDPDRLKPHTCPHRNCGRSFSRKHDLGRHLTSIHRDEMTGKRAIGIAKANRSWCESCGKGVVGRSSPCDCHDVK